MKKMWLRSMTLLFAAILFCGLAAAGDLTASGLKPASEPAQAAPLESAELMPAGSLGAPLVQGKTGSQITIPVWVHSGEQPIDAFGIDIQFDSAVLSFVSADPGSLDPNWLMFQVQETAPGALRAGGFVLESNIPPNSSGSLVDLHFKVIADTNNASVTLLKPVDDLEKFQLNPGLVQAVK